jgi:hypothetical protein
MGLFNTVTLDSKCPSCTRIVPLRVQYKFGATRLFSYSVGDKIQWGANDVGEPGHHIVVLGTPEQCTNCGHDDDREFYVYIVDDVIDSVELADGSWEELHTVGGYLVAGL